VTGPDPAYVALALVPGIGHSRIRALLSRFPTAAAVLAATQSDLEDVPGMGRAGATAVLAASAENAERLLARTRELGGVVLAPDDGGFPAVLRDIPDPPALLFAAGRLELGQRPAIAIVGSRAHTRYGAEVCRHLAGGAARAGLIVVSGMARGIDALAHLAALDAAGGTVGILGNGLGVIYPSANRALYERVQANGLFLTEFPPGERPNAGSFQRRNRLISGLARVTLVIEAREKSGALITVDCALSQGREVLAVPGPITSPTSVGCNRLIQSGAKPVLGLRDVLEEYGLDVPSAASPETVANLAPVERAALDALAAEPRHADEIADALGLSTADTLSALTALELQGFIAALPGKRFALSSGGLFPGS
jgi:DNA processing protein